MLESKIFSLHNLSLLLFLEKNYSKYVQRLILLVKVKLQKNRVVIYELCNKFHSTSPNRFSILPTKLVFHTHNGKNIFFREIACYNFFSCVSQSQVTFWYKKFWISKRLLNVYLPARCSFIWNSLWNFTSFM